ncbi:unnamed protein product, partial [Meganyctiphanes norvegica]
NQDTRHHSWNKFSKMKHLVLLLLAGAALARVPQNTRAVQYTRVYTDQNMNGNYLDVDDYVSDLAAYSFDNIIDSTCVNGIWMFYENTDFNQDVGKVYWMHGIDLCGNFPAEYTDMFSSIRFAGDPLDLNSDSWTLYQGSYFTGDEFFGVQDVADLENLDMRGSSFIITGTSAWTVYSGKSWTGDAICVYPNETDNGVNGQSFTFSMWPEIPLFGAPDNTIRSIRKGCWE